MKVEITGRTGVSVVDLPKPLRNYACGAVVDSEEAEATKQAWVDSGIAKVVDKPVKEKNV